MKVPPGTRHAAFNQGRSLPFPPYLTSSPAKVCRLGLVSPQCQAQGWAQPAHTEYSCRLADFPKALIAERTPSPRAPKLGSCPGPHAAGGRPLPASELLSCLKVLTATTAAPRTPDPVLICWV